MRITEQTCIIRGPLALLAVLALIAGACGSDDDTTGAAVIRTETDQTADTQPADSTAQAGTSDTSEDTTGATAEGTDPTSADDHDGDPTATDSGNGNGILVGDQPTRFFELDWQVVDVRRQPDDPADDGEDVDPSEDFVSVDLDIESRLEATSFSIPTSWISLNGADGRGIRPVDAFDRATGDNRRNRIDVEPNRTERVTVVFAIDAADTYDDGWIELDQDGYLPAALAGPQQIDEAARLPVTFDTTTYDGPFSRDEATIEIVEAYWSRELGADDTGTLLESPDFSSRRPVVGEAWLIVHFEVTCRRTGADTGGCNVSSGQVSVDGAGSEGSFVNGLTDYGETDGYWAAYPVPVDAETVELQIGEPDDDVSTAFTVTDLTPLQSLATPEL